MPSLDDLKKRIKSVKSTQKITKAMKMVAAAKLRKAQESAEKGRPYSQKMQNIILNLTKSINDPQNAPKPLPNPSNLILRLSTPLITPPPLFDDFLHGFDLIHSNLPYHFEA